jgi:epoxide hydrolase-like predicted phosphatase
MIKAVLFDFGGVLTESGKKGFIRNILADLYEVPVGELYTEDIQKAWRQNEVDEEGVLSVLNKHFGKHITKEMFYAKANIPVVPTAEVYEMAAKLRRAGIRTGILSNVFSATAEALRNQGFYDGFDPIVLSCAEGFAKPDEELYKIAIHKTGVAANETIFIDDQEKCRPPAEKLGMHFILAESPQQIIDDTLALVKRENSVTL